MQRCESSATASVPSRSRSPSRQPKKHSAILGICQPLLDIQAEVDMALVEKYGMQMDNCILAEDRHQPLFAEMQRLPNVRYISGGATQNSIRVAQWMLQKPNATAYMGCIGADDLGARMKDSIEKEGVRAAYMVDKETPTGCCAVLVCNNERSMCTSLKASCNYKPAHLLQPENLEILREATIVYISGFFITTSPDSIRIAAKEMKASGGYFSMNLGAPFLMHVPAFKTVFAEMMPYTDLLFGNESEALAWAESEGWETRDISFIALRLSLIPSQKQRRRTVVITRGCDSTVVCISGNMSYHPVIRIEKEKLVDTNAAGDAYVGGYLAALSRGFPVDECCRAAAYSASVIVQHPGCTYPEKPEYTLHEWGAPLGA